MSLPNIKFNISSSGLGLLQAAIEKTPGLILNGVAGDNEGGVEIEKPYQIFSLKDAENIGIVPDGPNAFAHKHIKAFYDEAGTGAELWFALSSFKMSKMVNGNTHLPNDLLQAAKGKIRILGVAQSPYITPATISNGLDEDVQVAVTNAQKLCEDYAKQYNNLRCILSGNYFTGVVSDLFDYTEEKFNKVAVLISDTEPLSGAAIGLALGRMAKIPSQRKISRVKDGPVANTAFFSSLQPAEVLENAWDEIDSKGYIFLRSFPNRSGYYFSSDKTLTQVDDDFNSLARGLVMDEAVLIAYDTLIEELSDEIPVTTTGTIQPAIVKSWQNNIERQINGLMVDQGKLSGVKAFIDENQNILVTNNLTVSLQLLPVGYADFITVNIGFTTNLE